MAAIESLEFISLLSANSCVQFSSVCHRRKGSTLVMCSYSIFWQL